MDTREKVRIVTAVIIFMMMLAAAMVLLFTGFYEDENVPLNFEEDPLTSDQFEGNGTLGNESEIELPGFPSDDSGQP